jgi:thiazole/oxazole-forming peptide maturase SagC family component
MEDKLKVLPFQIIEMEDKLILKRGLTSMVIPEKSALIIVKIIQKALIQSPKTVKELISLFSGSVHGLVESFIEHLKVKKFIVSENDKAHQILDSEKAQDIFYWHFNTHQKQISDILNEKKWVFVGINELNKKLIQSLFQDGKNNFIVVDDPALRNADYFNDDHKITDEFWMDNRLKCVSENEFRKEQHDIGFLIASSEFGSFYLLETWNAFAVENKITFYPLLLQNMVGYAGPLVIPDEGACLECLKLRQNSASHDFDEKRISEKFAFEGQQVVAYHHSMLNVLAEVGAFDLMKFKTNIQWEVGTFCEIDLLGGNMSRRKLIKAPRCKVCSPLTEIPLLNINKQLTSEDSWKEIEQTVGYDE